EKAEGRSEKECVVRATRHFLLLPSAFCLLPSSWQPKRVNHASLVRRFRQVRHRIHESQRGRRIARVESSRNDRSCPAADSGGDRHVLLTVGCLLGDRLADDSAGELYLPEE